MINFCVTCPSKVLVSWRIHGITTPNVTFRGFFHETESLFIEALSSSYFELDCSFVCATKEKMDLLDSDVKVLDVVSVFGPYIKFFVAEIGTKYQCLCIFFFNGIMVMASRPHGLLRLFG